MRHAAVVFCATRRANPSSLALLRSCRCRICGSRSKSRFCDINGRPIQRLHAEPVAEEFCYLHCCTTTTTGLFVLIRYRQNAKISSASSFLRVSPPTLQRQWYSPPSLLLPQLGVNHGLDRATSPRYLPSHAFCQRLHPNPREVIPI